LAGEKMKVSSLNRFKNRIISIKWFSETENEIKSLTGFVSDVDQNGITIEYNTSNNKKGLSIIQLKDIKDIVESEDTEVSKTEKKAFREEIKKVIKLYQDPWVPKTLPSIIKLCLTYRKWDKYSVIEELEDMVKSGELIKEGDSGSLIFPGEKQTGELDIDRIVTGITTSQRSRIITIRDIIKELESRYGANVPLADVVVAAREKGLDESKIEEVIAKMKREGELFEPKQGILRRFSVQGDKNGCDSNN